MTVSSSRISDNDERNDEDLKNKQQFNRVLYTDLNIKTNDILSTSNKSKEITSILSNPCVLNTLLATPEDCAKASRTEPLLLTTPIFHGKDTENATKFLTQLELYIESVLKSDCSTVLPIVWKFLRDKALSWYYQLAASAVRPQTWTDFTTLFLLQFNAPIHTVRRERAWEKCKQNENENINEFLIRLHTLWIEQRPNETEEDLAKHLLCRIRNDLYNMIKICHTASLNEIVAEIQQIESCLYGQSSDNGLLPNQLKHLSLHDRNITTDRCSNTHYSRKMTTSRMEFNTGYVPSRTLSRRDYNNFNTQNQRAFDTKTREHSNSHRCCQCENCKGSPKIHPKEYNGYRLIQSKQNAEKQQGNSKVKNQSHTHASVFVHRSIQLNTLEVDHDGNMNTPCVFCTVLCTSYCCTFCSKMNRSEKFKRICKLLEECANSAMWFDEVGSLVHRILEVIILRWNDDSIIM